MMRNLIRIIVFIVCLLLFPNHAYAPPRPGGGIIQPPTTIDPTTFSHLDVYLMNRSDGSESSASGITFSNYGDATADSPWVLADQFLWIEFESHYEGLWGLRIVTDNVDDLQSTYSGEVKSFYNPRGDADGDGNVAGDEDDFYGYGGIVLIRDEDNDGNLDTITDNPFFRIPLGWQVYNENTIYVSGFPIPRCWTIRPPEVVDTDGDGIYEDANVATEWWQEEGDSNGDGEPDGGAWAYLGDKNDTGGYVDIGDAVRWYSEDGQLVYNYSLVASGNGDTELRYAQHPGTENTDLADDDEEDKDGDGELYDDWDIYVYLAGRFWNTAYIDNDNDGDYETTVYFQLPAGEYRTTIYVELFHE